MAERRDFRVPVPCGNVTFELEFGGVRVRIEDLPTRRDPFLAEQYGAFAEEPGETVPLVIRCRESEGVVVPLPPPGEMTVIEIERAGGERYVVRSHWQDGWVDFASGRGEIVFTDRAWDRFALSLENFLRVVFQLRLIEKGRFLLHAAGVIDAGRAYLFFGPSGAGKTTATTFSAPRPTLSDDMVLIDPAGDEALALAVPFHMPFRPEVRAEGAFPVAAALRLRQAAEDRVELLSPARAVATVSASVPYVHELGLAHAGLTDLVARFCGQVPCADMYFTRSARFWDLLAGLPG